MSRNALLDGEETVQYTVPANDDENVRPSVGKQPTGSTESKWALAPVYDSGPTFIENVVFQNKVRSALPYRRITSRTTFANVNGAMLDDERIILFKKDYQAEHLELTVMGIVPETSDHAVLNQSLQNS
ncbi:hypothetical protein FRB95_000825 [Tulasnella sp. JGI-2019a]|nr:hypothetical protein FRB95_000825 [Tulasnella sp. JGI-2019a]